MLLAINDSEFKVIQLVSSLVLHLVARLQILATNQPIGHPKMVV